MDSRPQLSRWGGGGGGGDEDEAATGRRLVGDTRFRVSRSGGYREELKEESGVMGEGEVSCRGGLGLLGLLRGTGS